MSRERHSHATSSRVNHPIPVRRVVPAETAAEKEARLIAERERRDTQQADEWMRKHGHSW